MGQTWGMRSQDDTSPRPSGVGPSGLRPTEVKHVLLADDDGRARSALRLLLEETLVDVAGGFQVSEAADAWELRGQLRGSSFDLVILDWELPGTQSLTCLRLIRESQPTCRVITVSSRPEARSEALSGGAHGFVGRNDPAQALMKAVLDTIGT